MSWSTESYKTWERGKFLELVADTFVVDAHTFEPCTLKKGRALMFIRTDFFADRPDWVRLKLFNYEGDGLMRTVCVCLQTKDVLKHFRLKSYRV